MEPWYKSFSRELRSARDGRSIPTSSRSPWSRLPPGTAPDDYTDSNKFFARTCFTRALREHIGNGAAAPFRRDRQRGARSHPDHPVRRRQDSHAHRSVSSVRNAERRSTLAFKADLLQAAEIIATCRFAGGGVCRQRLGPRLTARETPWIDVARQLAGDAGVAALGPEARTTPPGTEAIGRVIRKAGGSVLILFDEVLNFLNRHREPGRRLLCLHPEPDRRDDRARAAAPASSACRAARSR